MSWWTSVYDIDMKDNGNKGLIWCGFLETQETLH